MRKREKEKSASNLWLIVQDEEMCYATFSACAPMVTDNEIFLPSNSMTPAESVATNNDCPQESPQTISCAKLLQND